MKVLGINCLEFSFKSEAKTRYYDEVINKHKLIFKEFNAFNCRVYYVSVESDDDHSVIEQLIDVPSSSSSMTGLNGHSSFSSPSRLKVILLLLFDLDSDF